MSISFTNTQMLLAMKEAKRTLDKTERYFYNTVPVEEYLNYPTGVTALEVEDFEWIRSLCYRTKRRRLI